MFKPNKLLKVISIIMIVLSLLGIMSVGASYLMVSTMEVPGVDMSALKETVTLSAVIISVAASLVMLAAGVMGVAAKSFKACAILIGLYIVYLVVATIINAVKTGFSPLVIVDFVVPSLYAWGLYQSKE